MANSQLYNKTFKVPKDILVFIQKQINNNPNSEGIKRAKHILKNKQLSYPAIKRIKNFFDNFNSKTDSEAQYNLAGGDKMKNFIEYELNKERSGVERSKEIKQDMNVDPSSGIKPYQKPRLNEADEKDIENVNVIGVIVNSENKILVLKRRDDSDWAPGQWAFAGGSAQEDEKPIESLIREIKEETGLDVTDITNTFNIIRHPYRNLEYVYVCRYFGDEDDVQINSEHSDYVWLSIDDVYALPNKAPNIIDYLSLCFKR